LQDARRSRPPRSRKSTNWTRRRPTAAAVEDPRFKEFFDHVRAYVKIHQAAELRGAEAEGDVDPKKVSSREKALADEIRIGTRRRPSGRRCLRLQPPGRLARSSPATSTSARSGNQKAILAEVPVKVPPSINTDYPTTLPLATVPPALLLKLPTLPEQLEYRFLAATSSCVTSTPT
jgi:hypothetical protein